LGQLLQTRLLAWDAAAGMDRWTRLVPVRATRLLAGLVIVGGAGYWGWLASPAPWAILAAIGSGGVLIALAMYAGRPGLEPARAWGAFAAASLIAVALAGNSLVPAVASWRSIHRALYTVRQRPELERVPLVFYCHEAYGSSIWLGESGCPEFDDDQRHRMREYLMQNRQVLIVSREEPIEILGESLPWPLAITRVPGARHLYLCDERATADRQPRTARRYDPRTAAWH
jgi:hypothetical protein